jgi:hypothetical protein
MTSLQIRWLAASLSGSPVLVVREAREVTTFGAWRDKGVTCAGEDGDVVGGGGMRISWFSYFLSSFVSFSSFHFSGKKAWFHMVSSP